ADLPDLLVTDVVMPGMNGRRLAERLQERQPGLRVLYLSGHGDTTARRNGVQASDANFLLKPFTPGDIARAVRETLDRPVPDIARPAEFPSATACGRHVCTKDHLPAMSRQ